MSANHFFIHLMREEEARKRNMARMFLSALAVVLPTWGLLAVLYILGTFVWVAVHP